MSDKFSPCPINKMMSQRYAILFSISLNFASYLFVFLMIPVEGKTNRRSQQWRTCVRMKSGCFWVIVNDTRFTERTRNSKQDRISLGHHFIYRTRTEFIGHLDFLMGKTKSDQNRVGALHYNCPDEPVDNFLISYI
jgi:hypothetical protein